MERQENEIWDDALYAIMKKGKLTMPFPDFEDNVMEKIHLDYSYKAVVSKNLKLSLIFFIIGVLLGGCLPVLFFTFGNSVFGLPPKALGLLILFIIAVVGIMSLDNFMRLIKKYS